MTFDFLKQNCMCSGSVMTLHEFGFPITSSKPCGDWQSCALCPTLTGGQGVKVGGCGHRVFIWLWVSVLHTHFLFLQAASCCTLNGGVQRYHHGTRVCFGQNGQNDYKCLCRWGYSTACGHRNSTDPLMAFWWSQRWRENYKPTQMRKGLLQGPIILCKYFYTIDVSVRADSFFFWMTAVEWLPQGPIIVIRWHWHPKIELPSLTGWQVWPFFF